MTPFLFSCDHISAKRSKKVTVWFSKKYMLSTVKAVLSAYELKCRKSVTK